MKKWAMLLLVSSSVFAAEGETNLSYSRVGKGNFSLSGSAGGGYSTGGIGFNAQSDISAMYYLIDHLAIGLDVSLSYYSGGQLLYGYIGPSIQYNFYNNSVFTAYTKISYLKELLRDTSLLRADVGADFWLGKNFSIGPFIRTTHHFSPYYYEDGTSTAVGGRLGLHF